MKIHPVLFASVLLLAIGPSFAVAEQYNKAVCVAPNDQNFPVTVADGFGGAIIVWSDYRNGNSDIYAQRITANGDPLWPVNGVPICTATDAQHTPFVAPDGGGGAIIAWLDHRAGMFWDWPTFDAYAQRINSQGQVQWQEDGVLLCDAPFGQNISAIISDGAGGAIIVWGDERFGPEWQWPQPRLYMQRLNASGQLLWGASGKSPCDPPCYNGLGNDNLISDGAGGVILQSYSRIHHIDGAGNEEWTPGGVLLNGADRGENFASVSDGQGGVIVTWDSDRISAISGYHIYAQKVDASGLNAWDSNAVTVCIAPQGQFYPLPVGDGSGGAIISWFDLRSGPTDMYAQHVDAAGAVQWTTNGVGVCTAGGSQDTQSIISDNAGGAIIAWNDYRTGDTFYYWDVYAQRINGAGIAQWTPDGIPVSTSENKQWGPKLASDGGSGAIVTWTDRRSGTNNDVYDQHLSGSGQILTGIGTSTPSAHLVLKDARPNPFSSDVTVDLTLPKESAVNVEVFDVAGRRVRSIDMGQLRAGPAILTFDGRDDHARPLASGVYFYRIHAGNETVTRKMVIAR